MSNRNLISPAALAELIDSSYQNLSILDASWYLPNQQRDAKAEFHEARIPSAQFFDIDLISDKTSPLPHMMPTPEQFSDQVSDLGVTETDLIVVYDGVGIFSCARVWWMLKSMGASDVRILEGGLTAWKSGGFPVDTGPVVPPKRAAFKPTFNSDLFRSLNDMAKNITSKHAEVLDARATERFEGTAPEPREGLRSGHIPGSRSLPFQTLMENGTLKSEEKISQIFSNLGITEQTPVITSCGSGVTAAVISLALDSIGHKNHSLYDGSWSEWGLNADVPVDTGSGG